MRICVYGASSDNINKSFIDAVEELGKKMAEHGHGLVFGGGATGLMGAAARGVYAAGGEIIGVAPSFFNVDGRLFENCTRIIYTETMRERKQTMEDLADAFIMVPGGIGTYEEFFEMLTLKQLARHNKAIAVYDINNYFRSIHRLMEDTVEYGFMSEETRGLYCVMDSADGIIDYIENYVPQDVDVSFLRNIK